MKKYCEMCGASVQGKQRFCWQCRIERNRAQSRARAHKSNTERLLSSFSKVRREAVVLFEEYWGVRYTSAAAKKQRAELREEQRRHDAAREAVRKRVQKIFALEKSECCGRVFVDLEQWQIRARFTGHPQTASQEWQRLCREHGAKTYDLTDRRAS